jgi:Tfp pilus assembly protein PilF
MVLLLSAIGVGVFGCGLRLIAPESAAGRMLLNLFLLEVFIIVATIIHEFGHAAAGLACGFRIQKIVVGLGPNIYVGRILGILTELKMIPAGGLAHGVPRSTQWLRTKWFFFTTGGPISNALTVLTLYWLGAAPLWPSFAIKHASAVEVCALASWATFVLSLWPCVVGTTAGPVPSDGLAILQLLLLRRMPFVPAGKRLRAEGMLRWMGAIFLWMASAGCLGLVLWVLLAETGLRAIWILVTVFSGIGLALAWLGWRALRAPTSTPTPWMGTSGNKLTQAFQREVYATVPKDVDPTVWTRLQKCMEERDWKSARVLLEGLGSNEDSAYVLRLMAHVCHSSGDPAAAERYCSGLESRLGHDAAVFARLETIRMIMYQGDVERAVNESERLISEITSVQDKVLVLDGLACFAIMERLRCFLPQADAYSKQALELQSQNLTLKGTRGSILVELGRYEEGEAMLKEVYEKSEADIDKGISALYLGLAAKGREDLEQGKAWGKKVKRLYPEEWLCKRVDADLLS